MAFTGPSCVSTVSKELSIWIELSNLKCLPLWNDEHLIWGLWYPQWFMIPVLPMSSYCCKITFYCLPCLPLKTSCNRISRLCECANDYTFYSCHPILINNDTFVQWLLLSTSFQIDLTVNWMVAVVPYRPTRKLVQFLSTHWFTIPPVFCWKAHPKTTDRCTWGYLRHDKPKFCRLAGWVVQSYNHIWWIFNNINNLHKQAICNTW